MTFREAQLQLQEIKKHYEEKFPEKSLCYSISYSEQYIGKVTVKCRIWAHTSEKKNAIVSENESFEYETWEQCFHKLDVWLNPPPFQPPTLEQCP